MCINVLQRSRTKDDSPIDLRSLKTSAQNDGFKLQHYRKTDKLLFLCTLLFLVVDF